MVSFIIQIFCTILASTYNENPDFTGINIWLIFTIIIIYQILKKTRTNIEPFLMYFFICFIPTFIINYYFTIFDFFEPNFYGFNQKLYSFSPANSNYDVKNFLFWQTGKSSGYNFDSNLSNKIITFFTVPPVALFECLIKAIFPNLYI